MRLRTSGPESGGIKARNEIGFQNIHRGGRRA
jgi:hypothetical protein